MDKFVKALKEHGYKYEDNRPYNGCLHVKVGSEYDPTKWVTVFEDEDCPALAFWCLDEIGRLGWWYSLTNNKNAVGGPRYEVSLSGDTWKDQHLVWGKTKTEACMNALIAVLEAKGK